MVRLWLFLLMFSSAPALAQVVIPAKKPTLTSESFDKLLTDVSTQQQPESTIPLPPPLPDAKKHQNRNESVAITKNGIPLPSKKPLQIRFTQHTKTEKIQNNDDVVIYYQGGGASDRMAGGRGRSGIERKTARPKDRLKETTEKSPFKTAKLPRAGRPSSGDPVIIFFKEQSSDLEVGQIDILRSDVLRRLKSSNSLRVAIYGYAQKNKKSVDKTNQLSLSRALMISEFLADHRIARNRIEIRSMGSDTPISPKNRVDIILN